MRGNCIGFPDTEEVRSMKKFYAGRVDEIPPGTHRLVEIEGKSVGVYNIRGDFHALLNYCPHEGAELCKGRVCGTTLPSGVFEYVYGRDGEILRCPWHGWEFEIKTGKSLFSEKIRTRHYEVEVSQGTLYVLM